MRLGKQVDLRRALRPYFGDVYTDDNDVVRFGDDASTIARLEPSREGFLYVYPVDGTPSFEIAVKGAGFEPHELGEGETRQ